MKHSFTLHIIKLSKKSDATTNPNLPTHGGELPVSHIYHSLRINWHNLKVFNPGRAATSLAFDIGLHWHDICTANLAFLMLGVLVGRDE